jgi:hypothetical protein
MSPRKKSKVEPGSDDQVVELYGDLKDVRYGSWRQTKDGRYLVPGILSGSDYSGSLVQKSNHRKFSEEFADGEDKWWGSAPGGHGTYAIVIDMQSVPEDKEEEVAEFLNALSDYPLADEDLHSEMEMEAQNKAWNDWARADFKKEIEKVYGVDLDEAEEELGEEVFNRKLYELFHKASEKANEYWVNEQGDSMYINLERVVAKGTVQENIEALYE